MATPAPACKQALQDATARWPRRNKASDGIMGDARHKQGPSDHNQGNAVDITHDPVSGCTGDVIAQAAIEDSRATYVIWNKRINHCDGRGWQKYTGENPHTKHCHISIRAKSRNDTTPWSWGTTSFVGPRELAPPNEADALLMPIKPRFPYMLQLGHTGPAVTTVQSLLRAQGWLVTIDGRFTKETEIAVKAFQIRKGILPSGCVDFITWQLLWESAKYYPNIYV